MKQTGEWVKVLADSELLEGTPAVVEVEDGKVLLVRAEGRIYACGNECSHYHAPLSDGLVTGHVVTCPWHNARFDIRDGRLDAPPGLNDLSSYQTKVEKGQIWIRQTGKGMIPAPEGHDDRTFLIVGAGASGNAAAETLRREGFAGRIVMITGEAYTPYDRTMLSKDLLSGEAPAKWLALRGQKFYDRLKIEILTEKPVTAVDPAARRVRFADGTSLSGDRILLASGGRPRKLSVPGAELAGCHLLRSRSDAEAILAELEQDARIPISELARRLDSPNSTIRDRIRALEENGVILGYTAIIDPEKLGLGVKAIIQASRAQSVSLGISIV